MIFLVAVAIGFGLEFNADGLVPALLVLVAFVPFVWGLGLISAAARSPSAAAPRASASPWR